MEDHAATLDLWASALRVVGYSVCPAASVAAALTCLEDGSVNTSVDLVIIDWHLPDGTGDEVCQATRQIQPTVPMIVISGVVGANEAGILACAPDAYFAKPVKVRALVETIERLLADRRAGKSV